MSKSIIIILTLLLTTCASAFCQHSSSATNKYADGIANGHAYVDLGLSVKWATTNLGALSPTDHGRYYAWGEVKAKNEYSIFNYKYFKQTENEAIGGVYLTSKYDRGYTKYVSELQADKEGYKSFWDDKRLLDYSDDAARAVWGGGWRIPTLGEMNELCTRCKWHWCIVNGKTVYKVTGPNGNHILLPASGTRFRMKTCYLGEDGFYWTATVYYGTKNNGAYTLHFNKKGFGITENETRYDGRSIRPVIKFKAKE